MVNAKYFANQDIFCNEKTLISYWGTFLLFYLFEAHPNWFQVELNLLRIITIPLVKLIWKVVVKNSIQYTTLGKILNMNWKRTTDRATFITLGFHMRIPSYMVQITPTWIAWKWNHDPKSDRRWWWGGEGCGACMCGLPHAIFKLSGSPFGRFGSPF